MTLEQAFLCSMPLNVAFLFFALTLTQKTSRLVPIATKVLVTTAALTTLGCATFLVTLYS